MYSLKLFDTYNNMYSLDYPKNTKIDRERNRQYMIQYFKNHDKRGWLHIILCDFK